MDIQHPDGTQSVVASFEQARTAALNERNRRSDEAWPEGYEDDGRFLVWLGDFTPGLLGGVVGVWVDKATGATEVVPQPTAIRASRHMRAVSAS